MSRENMTKGLSKAEMEALKVQQNKLLDSVMEKFELPNDAALAAVMVENPAVISKFRHGRLAINAAYQIKIHELTGFNIANIKRVLGVPAVTETVEHLDALRAVAKKKAAKQAA